MEDGEFACATWRKAARSQGNGACVEVANLSAGRIAVRDSKDTSIPAIIVTADQWRAFLTRSLRDDLS
jgi:Domain of unknown function (DUF397)